MTIYKSLNLFGAETIEDEISKIAIASDKFPDECFDYDSLKERSRKINHSSKDIIQYFFQRNGIRPERIPQYYTSWAWGEATGSYKFRYVIIEHRDKYYLVFLRIVGLYKPLYFSITYDILCNAPNGNDISYINSLLKSCNAITKFEVICDEKEAKYYNFYCDNEFSLSKNLRKHNRHAVKLLDNGVYIEIVTKRSYKKVYNDSDILYDFFMRNRFKFNKRVQKRMLDLCVNYDEGYAFAIYYNDKLIGLTILSEDYNRLLFEHCEKNISSFSFDEIKDYCGCDLTFAKKLHDYLGCLSEKWIRDYCFNNNLCDAIYADGVHGDMPSQLIHKKIWYNKVVYYKIIENDRYGTNTH